MRRAVMRMVNNSLKIMLILSGKSAENHAYLLVISDDKHLKEGADSLEFQ